MEKERSEKHLEVLDLPTGARELVAECELTGRRTFFQRNGRLVAVLVSHDEYVALRETIEITNDPALRARIESSDEELKRNAIMLPEDLFGE